MPRLSSLARHLNPETAFTVLALAREQKARGKDVVELEIGDSPFPSTPAAKAAGIRAIEENRTGYGPSLGLPELRSAAARWVCHEFGLPMELGPEHVVVASGGKPFEQYFAEALLEPGDGVLIFSPQFPTYVPNLQRVGARPVMTTLRSEHHFRPMAAQVADFLETDPRPRAMILNSPHNPTGGVATRDDLEAIADLIRGRDFLVFSDEPYCHMVWNGRHETLLAQPDMLEHTVAAYTFSKSYSMSGWRIGFGVAHPIVVDAIGKLINTTASCSPPFVQIAAVAALEQDREARDEAMRLFERKVELLSAGLKRIDGIVVEKPAGTFYVFPDVRAICNRFEITSQGLAMYFLEGADSQFGVACLGGECFGEAGAGFLRFSCAESDERLERAVEFLKDAVGREDRIHAYLSRNPGYRLKAPY